MGCSVIMKIEIRKRPKTLYKVLYFIFNTTVFILSYNVFVRFDLEGDELSLIKGALAIFFVVLFSLLLLRPNIVYGKKRFLSGNEKYLTILDRNGTAEKYKWEELSQITTYFDGVRLFQEILLINGETVVFEFTGNWIWSVFNSKRSLIQNYNQLIVCFANNEEWKAKLELKHFQELIHEFELKKPDWIT